MLAKLNIGMPRDLFSGGLSVRGMVYARDLLFELVAREMKLRYKRSVLGIVWSLLNPLAQLVVLYFVFGLMLPLHITHYASFLLIGVLSWNWFQSSLVYATGAIVDNRELVRRPGFPVAVLPIVTVTTHLLHFLLALPILVLCLFLDLGYVAGSMAALPLVIILQFLLTLSLAYTVATFHVSFRDTQYLLGVLLQLLFFLTPIFYDATAIPEPYRWLLSLNPMTYLVDAYRAVLVGGRPPDWRSLFVLGACSVALLLVTYAVFIRARYRFVEDV